MLVDSQQRHGVVIVGPVVDDSSWQAHAAEGFSKADFHVDWDEQRSVVRPARYAIWIAAETPWRGKIRLRNVDRARPTA